MDVRARPRKLGRNREQRKGELPRVSARGSRGARTSIRRAGTYDLRRGAQPSALPSPRRQDKRTTRRLRSREANPGRQRQGTFVTTGPDESPPPNY
jgi:hypothetical protein